ncbi:Uracil-DNA glycosylase (UDG) [Mycobacteroides abscessus subsp. bolletii]|uniref:uracil-DNA glycosylase n=1 Tax=Mycobacteroides abscessus TaxID=36809 RepID=UPI0009A65316|nr:uracil-DNA glycosylase [Mycobacteroides abscessus]MDO3069746.1 uracil-DNA glycosylase [Mycobacteroides abscessus subsp. bolletii]MDO3126258.1 uracil-DNA glycosylase [Mycobacteroides abscessus subsp. bolletii]SKF65650.1 Uracil-DNA glycosylase (UDG) [Mycobacteroides abscessus subsp. bolletii]SKF73693.1 Uracil-DNA glycosylase (UDG) [Mycobacteroides abscessus subsp. bolletii]SKO07572.1 uracil-DNA glycosylase [Mycobacteroides abscessus subsp. bolletii]
MTARPLAELVDPGWADALGPVADQVAKMGEFLREENSSGRGYLPAGANVLRAFTYPLADVRVLIVGQDPYPTPGHAMGLSFSVAADVRPVPRSLGNIFDEYQNDLGLPKPANGDLTPWSEQGVMLLNRVLTVRPGNPASHRGKGWEIVTECAIRALVARDAPLVAILWGRDAATLKPMLGPSVPTIESVHPSPLSASRGFFGSKPFSRANELLVGLGAQPVDWRLP